jgi:hypothetical protein
MPSIQSSPSDKSTESPGAMIFLSPVSSNHRITKTRLDIGMDVYMYRDPKGLERPVRSKRFSFADKVRILLAVPEFNWGPIWLKYSGRGHGLLGTVAIL